MSLLVVGLQLEAALLVHLLAGGKKDCDEENL